MDSSTTCLSGMVPHAKQAIGRVLEQRELASGTFVIRVDASEMANQIVPGQFFMIRPAGGSDPLLGRPFALYDTIVDSEGAPVAFEFAYHVIGKMTRLMSQWTGGETVEIWGPLGNGFPLYEGKHLLCVGGGIGYTPFLAVARETLGLRQYGRNQARYAEHHPAKAVTLCYGTQTKAARADLSDFNEFTPFSVRLSTDDGTEGHHGLVTDVVSELFELPVDDRPDGVYCCGPEPMMHAVARQCFDADIPCWLSLETPMACGFGACFSCVTKVHTEDGEWDYRRTCVEGPIFPARELAFP